MRKIGLETYQDRSGKHYFGWTGMEKIYFANKREADKYLRSLKKFLFYNSRKLRIMFNEITTNYNYNYFLFDDLDSEQIEELIAMFHKRYRYCFKDFSSGNKNSMVFHNFLTSSDLLKTVARIIRDQAHIKKNVQLSENMGVIIIDLEFLDKAITSGLRELDNF